MSSSTDNNGDSGMGKVRKFMFDTHDFDDANPAENEEEEAARFTEEDLAAAQQSGFEAGRQEGVRETQARQEEAIAATLERVAEAAALLVAQEDRREREKQSETARLALVIARKLFPALARKLAQQEIEAAVLETLGDRHDEPRIAVVVHDTMLEPLTKRIDELGAARGFAGKVIVIADENIPPTDCRIEWADGGAERKFEALLSRIEEELGRAVRNLNAGSAGTEAETEEKIEEDVT